MNRVLKLILSVYNVKAVNSYSFSYNNNNNEPKIHLKKMVNMNQLNNCCAKYYLRQLKNSRVFFGFEIKQSF